jgi:hypothetical protein
MVSTIEQATRFHVHRESTQAWVTAVPAICHTACLC